ncbi:sensor histidine kinase [Aliivibrio fischeri]|uniref:sensor histidine kinase n=1 Tax=Aliivibrio fischeri TaxID=668 RepID=UPI0012DA4A50|nr:sensor histidine kinase [Aliivibrio fischeri]MUJ36731.1 PhnD/SsuA/transferrin family substrate-binding protein [Aliivibrio fischeri]
MLSEWRILKERTCISILIGFICLLSTPALFAQAQIVDVGVLATRGAAEAHVRWQPTMDWLSSRILNSKFVLHPFSLDKMEQAIEKQTVDFVITNPGQAVRLGRQYPLSWLATLNSANTTNRMGTTHTIGSALVVRNDSSFKTIQSLSGESLAAVNENAFGGYLTLRFEINKLGLNQSNYFSNTQFLGFPLDALIYQLRDKHIDAAIVPVCLIEKMSREGLIEQSTYRVLNNITPDDFSCATSTPLYPNWSFAKTGRGNEQLAKLITRALLSLPSDHPAAVAANSFGWTPPISQLSVDKLYQGLDMHPLQKPWWQEAISWLKQNQQWAWMFFFLVIALNSYHFLLEYRFSRSKRKLESTLHSLKEKNLMLEHAQRVSIVGELGSSLAHEINQPLAAIRNYSQGGLLRLQKGLSAQELIPVLGKIEQQVVRADGIVQRLRKLINKRQISKVECDANSIITDTLELLIYDFKKKNIKLTRNDKSKACLLLGDEVGIQQVLLNVLNNAADACIQREEQEGNITHKIHIETECNADSVVIKVQDNGIGLKEEVELLSKAFFTTKENGLGLGLAICHDVIEAHQGQFLLDPILPRGCCVTVILPRLSTRS